MLNKTKTNSRLFVFENFTKPNFQKIFWKNKLILIGFLSILVYFCQQFVRNVFQKLLTICDWIVIIIFNKVFNKLLKMKYCKINSKGLFHITELDLYYRSFFFCFVLGRRKCNGRGSWWFVHTRKSRKSQ